MSASAAQSIPEQPAKELSLKSAFDQAIRFSVGSPDTLVLSDDAARKRAEEEAAFKRVFVDERSFTPGMRMHALQPVLDLWANWVQTKSPFSAAIQPFREKIDAIDNVQSKIDAAKARRAQVKELIELREGTHTFNDAKATADSARQDFAEIEDREGRRSTNMGAYNPLYWVGLLSIGAAEWMINFDTFFFFFGVPAIAAGTTLVLGALLAFSAHGHGTLLKQWVNRFGPDQPTQERTSTWWFFAFSTCCLLLVIAAAGGSRFAYAQRIMVSIAGASGHSGLNIVGAAIDANPLRDVGLSLLGNVGAWALGVFLAYLCHDKNPAYMDAKRKWQRAQKRFDKLARVRDQDIRVEDAKIEREINELERAAESKMRDVQEQRGMQLQVRALEESIKSHCLGIIQRNIKAYHGAIANCVLARKGEVELIRNEKSLTPFEYKEMAPSVDGALLEGVAS